MDIVKLRLFLSLSNHLHFNRAADACHVSASTLSRAIQQLEEEAKSKLFVRDNRSVSLTNQGRQFLVFATETVQQWETLQEQLQENAVHLHGALSIYCSVTASYSFLYDILTDFRKQHPGISITIHTGDPALALERVLAGSEDIAIAAKVETMPPVLDFKKITNSPLVLIQPLEFDSTNMAKQPEQFWQTVPFILSERGVARERMDKWFQRQQIQPNIYAQVAGHEAIVSMVSLGFGVGLVPKIVLDNSPLANKVRPLERQPELPDYEVGLCVLKRRLKSPIVRAFWQQIRDVTSA